MIQDNSLGDSLRLANDEGCRSFEFENERSRLDLADVHNYALPTIGVYADNGASLCFVRRMVVVPNGSSAVHFGNAENQEFCGAYAA